MALNITITDDYKLTSDALNIIVNRKHLVDPTKSPNWARMKAEGHDGSVRVEWKEVAYCRTVEMALSYVAEQSIRESDAETIGELLSEITAIRREISAVLRK